MFLFKPRMALLSALTAALTAAAISVPGAAGAGAQTEVPIYLGYVGQTPLFTVYAHAHGSNIQVTDNPAQLQGWNIINPATWQDPINGDNEPVYEMEVATTGLCINLGPDHYYYWLDSCQKGDRNEQLWFRPYIASGFFAGWNIANVAASDANHAAGSNEYGYLTASGFYNYADLIDWGPGSGARAVWQYNP